MPSISQPRISRHLPLRNSNRKSIRRTLRKRRLPLLPMCSYGCATRRRNSLGKGRPPFPTLRYRNLKQHPCSCLQIPPERPTTSRYWSPTTHRHRLGRYPHRAGLNGLVLAKIAASAKWGCGWNHESNIWDGFWNSPGEVYVGGHVRYCE